MKPDSWLIYWFAPDPWAEFIYESLTDAGFKTHRMWGLWTKPTGQTLSPFTRLANSYETFYYAAKGQPKINQPGRSNIFNYAKVPDAEKTHPTERPLPLIREIIKTFTKQNAEICVPFLGSGKSILAAHDCQRNAFGFELTPLFKDHFIVNVHQLRKDGKL